MITVNFKDEEAQLVANLLANHKQNNQRVADLSMDALTKLLDASKQKAKENGEAQTNDEGRETTQDS